MHGDTLRPVDLRSDTVTKPDAAMRRAMAEAEVGDDVFGEDPTVQRLQQLAAERLAMEAALYVPSGTMANQIALHLHGRAGSHVACAEDGHVLLYELAAVAAVSGMLTWTVPLAADGRLDPATLEAALPMPAPYRAPVRVLVIENSRNMAGGVIYRRPQLDELQAVGRRHQLALHLDGARLFNAAAAAGVEAAELARGFDTVSFCLSKGLGAPVGSLLCGTRELIDEAWRVRKMLGGGMRQVGVLAAAGLLALEHGPGRLANDHANAHRLAEGLAEIDGIDIDLDRVETNIVIFRLAGSAPELVAALDAHGIRCLPISADQVRMVTHRDVDLAGVERAIEAVRELVIPATASSRS